MGKMSFSSMVELEKKKERGGFWCVWGGKGEGEGSQARWRGQWDPIGVRGAASLRERHARTRSHGPSVREVRTVRPFQTETSLLSLNSKLDLPSLQKFPKNLC
jgi:hypothetical protein